MIHFSEYKFHESEILGDRKRIDNTIYTFDIETTSFLILDNKQLEAIKYENLTKKEQENVEVRSCMYIWMFSINEKVYYGRTWEDLKEFLNKLNNNVEEKKIVFIHNLAFEFQFLKSEFNIKDVIARKAHKVMSCILEDYNIELRCSYFMSNCALKELPKLFNLPVEKMAGDLDYEKIRTSDTILSKKELKYCENDCLVVYYYILEELKTYKRVDKIPLTSTGHVRRELKEIVREDYKYKALVKKSINTDPHLYNLLMEAFAGGYTHANWIYADTVLHNVSSYDFTSSYPYVMVTSLFPSTEFKKCYVNKKENLLKRFAYILVVKFKNIKSKFYNNILSASKCRNIKKARYDNGRIIEAEELEITITDIDFRLILEAYSGNYIILESYFSKYNFLPSTFIEFILEKYVNKTKFKNVEGMEINYVKEKNKFNSLYGMCVTNMIRDHVYFEKEKDWWEEKLTNEEIIEMLNKEKNKSFLSFSYGVWVTAYARNNLLRNVLKLDDYVVYCDTDSIKLIERV